MSFLRIFPAITVVFLVFAMPTPAPAQTIQSYAIVNNDGSLRVRGETIRLFGVFIPDSGRVCSARIRPARCGDRAARALDTRIRGFVSCAVQNRNADGSLGAFCSINEGSIFDPPLDLGEFLIREGLAVAAPGAPFAYQIQQEVARENGRGIWGFFADDVRFRGFRFR